ncbi:chaplin [Streptomyces sp. NPDC101206]|uniref:chaplin n=1 Tax=Streptomyces sp. NPDC101206 TaxID=3366128 RepID=UPI00380F5B6E
MSRIAKAVAVTAAAGSALAAGAGLAVADAGAHGAAIGSPGVLSGNVVQVPVHIPINVCGNSVNVIGLLNPAFGNTCINASGAAKHHTEGSYGD